MFLFFALNFLVDVWHSFLLLMSIVDVHYGCAFLGALSIDSFAFVADVSC